jgi:hypothetical protein
LAAVLHHSTNAIDADLSVLGLAIQQPPAQIQRLSAALGNENNVVFALPLAVI